MMVRPIRALGLLYPWPVVHFLIKEFRQWCECCALWIGRYPCSIRVQIHGWRHGKLVRCFSQHGARFWKCLWDYFGLSKWKPRKKFRMSYLQREKMEKQRRKEYLTTWECLHNKLTGRKLHESYRVSSLRENRWYVKCFRHYSVLSKWRRWKTFRGNFLQVRCRKKEEAETKSSVWDKKCLK